MKKICVALLAIAIVCIAVVGVNTMQKNAMYIETKQQLEAAQDSETISRTIIGIIKNFEDLGDYKESKLLLQEAQLKLIANELTHGYADVAIAYLHEPGMLESYPEKEKLLAEAYIMEADRFLMENKPAEAIQMLLSSNTQLPEVAEKLSNARFAYAQQLEAAGRYEEAQQAYLKSEHEMGLKMAYSVKYAHMLTKDKIAIGPYSKVYALTKDGKVVYTGSERNPVNPVANWTDIVAIDCSLGGTLVGLKTDGTVVAWSKDGLGELDVSGWRNIVAISVGRGHIVGLKSDGTLVATGNNHSYQCDVHDLQNVIAISAGSDSTYAILADGNPYKIGMQMRDLRLEKVSSRMTNWPKLSTIVEGGDQVAGITLQGDAVLGNEAYTDYYYGDRHEKGIYYTWSGSEFNESDINHKHWRDIVCLETDDYHCIAVRKDGSVFLGCNTNFTVPSKEVATWTNVAAIASYDNYQVVALLKNGTLVGSGLDSKVAQAISEWSDITCGGRGLQ